MEQVNKDFVLCVLTASSSYTGRLALMLKTCQ